MFPYFELFGKTIGTYAICSVIGLFICCITVNIIFKEQKVHYEDTILLTLSAVIGLFIGGHILYGITNIKGILNVLSNISDYSFITFFKKMIQYFGGMVFYGGFIGAYIAILIHTKISNCIRKDIALDMFAVSIPLFHTFARIGCFLGGCCYGKEWSWGFTAHGNTLSPSVNDVLRIPVQLIESGCNLLIFLVILYILKKKRCEGKLVYIYMILYPISRFILEFFRGDEIRGFIFGISTSQWISIILFIFSITKLTIKYTKIRK